MLEYYVRYLGNIQKNDGGIIMTIEEKSSEYAEKCFPSDDISNYGKHDVAFHSHTAGANWMLEKAIDWLQGHVNDYLFDDGTPDRPWLKCKSEMFDAFKKAMEE